MAQPLVTTLACTTLVAPDPSALCSIFTDVMGWETAAEDKLGAEETAAWGVAPRSAGDRFTILRPHGARRGMVRVVQGPARPKPAFFEARWAGIEMIVSHDIDRLYDALRASGGFTTMKAPRNADWSAQGSNIHRSVFGHIEGGTRLALTMKVTELTRPGRDFPEATAWVGHVFEVPLMTADYAAETRFWRGTLGMVPILESHFPPGAGGVMHDFFGIDPALDVRLDILKGDAPGTGLGGVEVQGHAASLIDPAPAVPDRLDGGAAMVTYTSADIDAAHAACAANAELRVLGPPRPVSGPPYRGARAFALLSPGGARLEIGEAFDV